MLLLILLVIAIAAQLFAAIIAIRLTQTTKYNSAWILITLGLVLTCILLIGQFVKTRGIYIQNPIVQEIHANAVIWISVSLSLCFAVGVFLVRKVLIYNAEQEDYRRRSEERTLNAIIQAEEAQRMQFAKELHDGLGPLLSTAKLSISALSLRNADPVALEIIATAQQAISLSINSIKEISNNLSPHVLNNFGLKKALAGFINRIRGVVDIKIIFDTNLDNERFSSDHEVVAYRVTCELINNVLKHSQAKLMIITLMYVKDVMTIEVRDDGCGYNQDEVGDGMGLSNIASRIGSVKGMVSIESEIGGGTHVRITIPLKMAIKG